MNNQINHAVTYGMQVSQSSNNGWVAVWGTFLARDPGFAVVLERGLEVAYV